MDDSSLDVFISPSPALLEAAEHFLGSFVAFRFQVSLPRQLESIRITHWTVPSASKELIKEAGEGLRSLKVHFLRSEQPFTAQQLRTEFHFHVFSVTGCFGAAWGGEAAISNKIQHSLDFCFHV